MRLHFAYHINLTDLTENGRIQYINSENELVYIKTYERLKNTDFVEIAKKALNQGLYHIAIDFTKEATRDHLH